jgi:3',5'-cyclic-AMP phosphodiesterase
MIIAQITDCHVAPPGVLVGRVDTASTLRRVVDHVNAMVPLPEVVLVTGDLANDGLQVEYDRIGEILAGLTMPLFAIPGNHDDRTRLRGLFPHMLPSGGPNDPIDYVVEGFEVRMVGLDTSSPGHHGGVLEPDQLVWLDEVLGAEPDRPTIVFQHHPPFVTGVDWMDADGFPGAPELADVLIRHQHVEAVVCGHMHKAIHRRFGGTVASCWPSTGVQLGLSLNAKRLVLVPESPAVAVHRWTAADGLCSHLSQVDSVAWRPKVWTEYVDV